MAAEKTEKSWFKTGIQMCKPRVNVQGNVQLWWIFHDVLIFDLGYHNEMRGNSTIDCHLCSKQFRARFVENCSDCLKESWCVPSFNYVSKKWKYVPEIMKFLDFDAHNFNICFIPNNFLLHNDSRYTLHSAVTRPCGCVRRYTSSKSKTTLHILIKFYVSYPRWKLSNERMCNFCALLENHFPCYRPIWNSTCNSSNFCNHFMVQKDLNIK